MRHRRPRGTPRAWPETAAPVPGARPRRRTARPARAAYADPAPEGRPHRPAPPPAAPPGTGIPARLRAPAGPTSAHRSNARQSMSNLLCQRFRTTLHVSQEVVHHVEEAFRLLDMRHVAG